VFGDILCLEDTSGESKKGDLSVWLESFVPDEVLGVVKSGLSVRLAGLALDEVLLLVLPGGSWLWTFGSAVFSGS
jgi:hypothetical protein